MYVTLFSQQEPIDKNGWVPQILSLDRRIKYLLCGGTSEMGDQWKQSRKGCTGGPMRWVTNENCVTRATLWDQWDGGTNENCVTRVTLGDQWDGGPMSTDTKVYIGAPIRWGTNHLSVSWPLGELPPIILQHRGCCRPCGWQLLLAATLSGKHCWYHYNHCNLEAR